MIFHPLFNKYLGPALALIWFFYIAFIFPLMHDLLSLHLFVAIPTLIVLGYVMGKTIFPEPKIIAQWNRSGVPALLLANIVFIFWMIPRFLDESVQQQDFYFYKVISFTFLCGVPLAWSLHKASYIAVNFFRIEFISTLCRMAWLFMTAKNRLCVNYLYSEQAIVGNAFLALAILFSLWPACKVIFGQYKENAETTSLRIPECNKL